MKPTEEWRKLFFDLSDQAFFDLVRNYLGDIHTPFNKHTLLDQLEHFLLNKTNLEQLFSMIDSSDAALLSAIDLLGTATIDRLYAIFSDEIPFYSFYTHLLNLEERLLICPVQGKKGTRTVVISPLFRDELRRRVIDIDLLLGCSKASEKKKTSYCWYDVPVIAAYVSSLLPKKVRSLNLEHGDIIKDILISQSLVRQSGRHLVPVMDNFRDLFGMEWTDVSSFFINSYLSSDPVEMQLYENMRNDRSYPEAAFRRLVLCTAYMSDLEPGDIKNHKERLVGAGLAWEDDSGLHKVTSFPSSEKGKIVVQPDFSIYVQGDMNLRESMMLALCSEIRELDVISHWEITRESFMRGLRYGISASSFMGLLESMSGNPLPQNILFSFKSWEEECQGIAVYRGCIVKVDQRFSKLLESNSTFRKYVQEKLADGIYLVSDEDFPVAVKVVESVTDQSLVLPWEKKASSIVIPVPDTHISERFSCCERPADPAKKRDNSEKLLEKIASLDITQEQKDILADRLHRKLILSEKQLKDSSTRYEFVEARGIDYTGKVRLCQHVLEAGGSFLELSMGSEDTILMKPVQMKKTGNDFLITGDEIPDGSPVQVYLRKVRLVRKVRTSLMG